MELSRQAISCKLVMVHQLVKSLKEGAIIDWKPPISMPYNLEMVHLVPGPHGEYKTAGYTHALPHQEESFSSTAGTTADQMGRVLSGDFTVEPPIWLVCETHTSLSESQIGRV